jgi:hypothetical protein
VLTHTNPPSATRRLTLDREQTVSQVHALPIDLARPVKVSLHWTLAGGATLSPLVLARLTTMLPDKYPGQKILFQAKVMELEGRAELARTGGHWPVVFGVKYGKTWSYVKAQQFSRDAAQASVRVGYMR